MNKNYRWGIIGAGRIAEKFCTALNFADGAEVYAIASRDKDKAKAYAIRFNASKEYSNYDDLIADENVDIIYIATPHVFHYDLTLKCLRNGKAVLCEKPLSLSYEHTKIMIDTARANNIFLMEGLWTSCMPFIEKIGSIIRQDIIGLPKYVSADFGFEAPVDIEGRLYNKKLGGGSLADLGIYPLFLATLIFGEPSLIKAVSKLTQTGVDEYANVLLQFAGGETAHLFSTITLNTGIEAEIIGTKGKIRIKNPWFKATDLAVILKEGSTEEFTFPHNNNGFEFEIMEVMHCLDERLLQSNKMPHHHSLLLSKIMDVILEEAGVDYYPGV